MPEHKLRKVALDEITLNNAADLIAEALKAKGCIVLVLNDDRTIGMTSSGINHYKANELLSVGIHINLSQHDEAVAKGEAGEAAQRTQLSIVGGDR
jgi:hypothetical protein